MLLAIQAGSAAPLSHLHVLSLCSAGPMLFYSLAPWEPETAGSVLYPSRLAAPPIDPSACWRWEFVHSGREADMQEPGWAS